MHHPVLWQGQTKKLAEGICAAFQFDCRCDLRQNKLTPVHLTWGMTPQRWGVFEFEKNIMREMKLSIAALVKIEKSFTQDKRGKRLGKYHALGNDARRKGLW